jgi:hypothetical protein
MIPEYGKGVKRAGEITVRKHSGVEAPNGGTELGAPGLRPPAGVR